MHAYRSQNDYSYQCNQGKSSASGGRNAWSYLGRDQPCSWTKSEIKTNTNSWQTWQTLNLEKLFSVVLRLSRQRKKEKGISK